MYIRRAIIHDAVFLHQSIASDTVFLSPETSYLFSPHDDRELDKQHGETSSLSTENSFSASAEKNNDHQRPREWSKTPSVSTVNSFSVKPLQSLDKQAAKDRTTSAISTDNSFSVDIESTITDNQEKYAKSEVSTSTDEAASFGKEKVKRCHFIVELDSLVSYGSLAIC